MAFKLKSGNKSAFKNMGSSPAKHPKHSDHHTKQAETRAEMLELFEKQNKKPTKYKDLTPEKKQDEPTPAKQRLKKGGEAQDEDKIFNKKGEHVGDYVNGKKVMKYYYKINNKPVTRAQYMKYQNKPGGEEAGKQTNDPTASLARQSANKRK